MSSKIEFKKFQKFKKGLEPPTPSLPIPNNGRRGGIFGRDLPHCQSQKEEDGVHEQLLRQIHRLSQDLHFREGGGNGWETWALIQRNTAKYSENKDILMLV